jgi:hypothetical protein
VEVIKEMGRSSKRSIYEPSFGYNSKKGVYTTSMSDIPKLDEMFLGVRDQDEEQTISNLG